MLKKLYLWPGCWTRFTAWGGVFKNEYQDQFSWEQPSWNIWKMGTTNESWFDAEITSGWRRYVPFKLSATILSKWKQAKSLSEDNGPCCGRGSSSSFTVLEVSFTRGPTTCPDLAAQCGADKHWWKSWKIQSTHAFCLGLLLKKRSSFGKGHSVNWRM